MFSVLLVSPLRMAYFMMKSTLALLFVFVVIYFTSATSAQTETHTEARLLDQLEQDTANYNRNLITELARFQKFDSMPVPVGLLKINERVNWLTDRVKKPDADYRLAYILAVYQWKMGNSRDSALSLTKADLRSFVDSQRCEDQSSPPSRLATWRRATQPIYEVIRSASDDLKVEIRNAIEREEGNLHLRTNPAWMCSGGAQHIMKLIKKYPEIGAHDASKPIPQTLLDKYPSVISVKDGRIELTDFSIPPDFRPEEMWKRDLPEMTATFKQNYFSMLGIKCRLTTRSIGL